MAIKRPVVIAMLALILGEFLAVMGGHIWMFILCVPLLIVQKITTKRTEIFLVVIFLFAFLGFCVTGNEMENSKNVYLLEEKKVDITGSYEKFEKTSYGYRYYLREVEIAGVKSSSKDRKICLKKIMVYCEKKPEFKPENQIRLKGQLKQFNVAGNYGEFDTRNYYKSLGIYISVEEEKSQVINEESSLFRSKMQELKDILEETFDYICNDLNKGIFQICDGEKSGIYKSIILGDKSDLSDEINDLYQINGIAHILAISGLHISSIGIVIYKIFRKRFKFVISCTASILIVLGFVFMSGMGISAIRAVGMFTFYLFSQMLGRKYDMLSAMSFVVILLCLDNPFVLANVSFQMSYGAMLGILFINPILSDFLGTMYKKRVSLKDINKKEYWKEKVRLFIKNVLINMETSVVLSISINLILLPILAYNYFEISVYGTLLNVIVIPLMTIVLGCGIVAALGTCGVNVLSTIIIGKEIFASAYVVLSKIVILPGCVILEGYEVLCELFSKVPGNVYLTGKPVMLQIVVYYIFLFMIILVVKIVVSKRKEREKSQEENIPDEGRIMAIKSRRERVGEYILKCLKCGVILVLTILLISMISCHDNGKLQVLINDVGQGECILLKKDNFTVMVDGGSSDVKNLKEYRLEPILKSRATKKLNYLIITHADSDHISGVTELLSDIAENRIIIENLIIPIAVIKDDGFEKLINAADKGNTKVTYIGRGDFIEKNGVRIECLHPADEFNADDRNSYSTVLDVSYKKFRMLLTGDISSEEEKLVMEELKNESVLKKYNYAILKVAHHGSKYSTSDEFLNTVRPQFSVISCGENNSYGHPSAEVLKRLETVNSKVYRTDLSGQIVFETDGESMEIVEFD